MKYSHTTKGDIPRMLNGDPVKGMHIDRVELEDGTEIWTFIKSSVPFANVPEPPAIEELFELMFSSPTPDRGEQVMSSE